MKNTIAILSAVVLLVTALFAGTVMAAGQEDLYGEWHIKSMKQGDVEMEASVLTALGMDVLLTLGEDGTVTMNMQGQMQEGTWTFDGAGGIIQFEAEVPFVYEDGILEVGKDGDFMTFSKEAADAIDVSLAPAVEGAQIDDFNGNWNATYYVAFGAPLPLVMMGAEVSLSIEDGKALVSETVVNLEDRSEIIDSMEKEFPAALEEDGSVYIDFEGEKILDKIGMEASGVYLTLHEDGRISATTPEIREATETLKALSEGSENTSAEGAEGAGTESSGDSAGMSMDTYLILEKAE